MTMIDRDEPVVISNLRTDTNDAESFLEFVSFLCWSFYLKRGDVLVMDNARIHSAMAIAERLADVLDGAGARLLFLPKYSPELNPCELVFAQVKRRIRQRRSHTPTPFWIEVLEAFAKVTTTNVCNFYAHCLNHPFAR